MVESINQRQFKKKIQNLVEFTSSDIRIRRKFNPRLKNHPTYRCVLGCSLTENHTSRPSWDVKLIRKEENKSLVLERR